jgi:hypothetical protein
MRTSNRDDETGEAAPWPDNEPAQTMCEPAERNLATTRRPDVSIVYFQTASWVIGHGRDRARAHPAGYPSEDSTTRRWLRSSAARA